ncbi:monocarboxylate transporter 9-like, partial [Clarias magur]
MAAVMKDTAQDSSWSIVFASFMAQLLAFGSPQAVGVLYPEWLSTFHEGKSTTAWISSTVLGVGLITGTSVGGFVYASMQNKLIDKYGLDGCLLIVGALALNLIACAGPMRPLNLPGYYINQKATLNLADEPVYDKELGTELSTKPQTLVGIIKKRLQPNAQYMHDMHECLREPSFVALCVSFFLYSLGSMPPILLMEDIAQSKGLLEHVASIPLVSITTAAAGVGKLALGILADVHWVNSLQLYAVTVVAMGAILLVLPMWNSYVGLQVLSAAIGFFSGNWSITSYVTTRLVGIKRLGQAHGLLMCFGGCGIILGPPVA